MSDKETSICYSEEDLGKNLYRKKTYYTLVIEQDVLANNEDEADRLFQDSGINHEKINTELTEENNGVETYYVDANYTDSGKTEYIGKVNYDPMDDDAEENGDVIIDDMAPENTEQDDEYQQERANHIAKSMDRGEW
jgi:hypothetical protein|tara:strand:- start:5574 stop:5984 length:411 start_codon:yes stop_codon:yes gene_type:complete